MKTVSVATALYLVLALPQGVTSAHAQDVRAQARELFGQGVEQHAARDFRAALESFLGAYRLSPHPTVRVNIANCYEELDLPVQALFHFEGFLEEAPNAVPAQRREVQRAIRRLRQRVGEVAMRIDPPGASVLLDGAQPREAPIEDTVRLAAGRHSIEVRKRGFTAVEREFEVQGGELMQFSVELVPIETVPLADQSAQEPTTASTQPQPQTQPDSVASVSSEAQVVGEGGGLGTPVLIVGSATAAVLVASVITGVLALGADSDFEDAVARSNDRSLPRRDREAARLDGLDAADRADTLAIVTDVLLVGGLVGLGITTYLFLADGEESETATIAHVDAVPVALPGGGGLVLSGAF